MGEILELRATHSHRVDRLRGAWEHDDRIDDREYREDHYPEAVCTCEGEDREELCYSCVVTGHRGRAEVEQIWRSRKYERRSKLKAWAEILDERLADLLTAQTEGALDASAQRAEDDQEEMRGLAEDPAQLALWSTIRYTLQSGAYESDPLCKTRHANDDVICVDNATLWASDCGWLEYEAAHDGRAVCLKFATSHYMHVNDGWALNTFFYADGKGLPSDLCNLLLEFVPLKWSFNVYRSLPPETTIAHIGDKCYPPTIMTHKAAKLMASHPLFVMEDTRLVWKGTVSIKPRRKSWPLAQDPDEVFMDDTESEVESEYEYTLMETRSEPGLDKPAQLVRADATVSPLNVEIVDSMEI